ncbi:MAG TPA: DsrE family protein [Candidatus Lokiarchaeia archaeon]|nr:DsrE family protein [Candidatus Lokiarchaeia archaeon]
MVKFAFLVCTAPYTFQNADTMYQMVDAALQLGHEVTGVFFFVDGVINASRKIQVDTGVRNLPEKLRHLVEIGIPVAICSVCAQYRGVCEEDLSPGVDFAGLMTFGDITSQADKLVAFGL